LDGWEVWVGEDEGDVEVCDVGVIIWCDAAIFDEGDAADT
jgi:hypothetical protein